MSNPPEMTTAQIVAEYPVSVRTVHRMVTAGALRPKFKVPGKTGAYVFRRADVERAMQKRSAA